MNNYAETKKELDRIKCVYGCKGDMIFRTAIQYVVDYGQRKFKNGEWVKEQLSLVDAKHDKAESEGAMLWIGRDFEKALIECAAEIAAADTYNLLIYIQKEVWLSNEGGIDYQRAVELLKKCMADIEESYYCNNKETYDAFEYIGFTDDEIVMFGFGYLLNYEEEEEK